MPVLEAYDTAARMKEVVGSIAADVVKSMVPRPRYGTVTAVNTTTRRVTLTYPDENVSVSVPGNTMLPNVGAVVRVGGYDGGRFIDDVVSGPVVFSNDVDVSGTLRTGSISANGDIRTVGTVQADKFAGDGSGLTGINVSLVEGGVLGIQNGGTGGNTQATARQALGLATMSATPVASTLVQRDPNGFIFTNYLNMVADVQPGTPTRFAGMSGTDNFLRWYTKVPASMFDGAIPNTGLDGGSYQPANLHASLTLSTSGTSSAQKFIGGGNTTGGIAGGFGAVLRDDSGDHSIHFDWNGSALVFYVDTTAVSYLVNGTFLSSAGTKTFVIDHPVDQSRYLVHACAEGPTTDVFYRGEVWLDYSGQGYVQLPDYFEYLTTENRTIQVTGTEAPAWASGYINGGRFSVYGRPNTKVYWRVDAERRNAEFTTEPLKAETRVEGFGPYRFIR